MIRMIKRIWKWFWAPSLGVALGVLLLIGFASGVIFWGGFNWGLEATNTEAFCLGCHEMKNNVGKEFTGTIHDSNRSGVRATCPDCHVPKDWGAKMLRKIEASNELYHKLMGTVNTPEKFEQHRGELAKREWIRMKKNDSQTCRNCHNFSSMDLSAQNPRAQTGHTFAKANGKTCIDCHKGIAHELPANAFEIEKEVNALFENKR